MRRKTQAFHAESDIEVPDWVLWCRDRRYVAARAFGDRGRVEGMREASSGLQARAQAWCRARGLSFDMTAGWASEPSPAEAAAGVTSGVLGRKERRRRPVDAVFADAVSDFEAELP